MKAHANGIFLTFHMEIYRRDYSWFYAWRSWNCDSLSLSQHMLLLSLFTSKAGSVLQLDLLSHFLTFVWGKNRVLVS